MANQSICPVLLAAGQSRRFGSDKLLHPVLYQGEFKPLIIQSLRPWLDVFSEVSVVLREDNLALLHLLQDSPCSAQLKLVRINDADQGMSASFTAGIKANFDAAGWLIGLMDMPYIQSDVIRESLNALQAEALITVPEYKGRRGHPVGFAACFRSQLLTLKGDKGAREIISSHQAQITSIPSLDAGICEDIDTVENIR